MLVVGAARFLVALEDAATAACEEVILGGSVALVDAGCEEAGGPAVRGALLDDFLGRLVGELAETG